MAGAKSGGVGEDAVWQNAWISQIFVAVTDEQGGLTPTTVGPKRIDQLSRIAAEAR